MVVPDSRGDCLLHLVQYWSLKFLALVPLPGTRRWLYVHPLRTILRDHTGDAAP